MDCYDECLFINGDVPQFYAVFLDFIENGLLLMMLFTWNLKQMPL